MNPVSRLFKGFPVPLKWVFYRPVLLSLALGSVCLVATGAWGQQVLVAGGTISFDPASYTTSAEVFDPLAATWTLTANNIPNPPPDGLCSPNMVSLGSRKVLLAGGGCSNNQNNTTNAASLYDPATNQWTATGTGIPNFMNFGRDQFGMVELLGGNAIAFAGCSGGCTENNILGQGFQQVADSAEIYSFQNNAWIVVATLNHDRGNLETNNLNQPAIVLQDGRVLTCNGNLNGVDELTNTCEIYDPTANTWTATGQMGTNETGLHQFVVLPNGQVLTVLNDGLHYSLFDPVAGTWSSPQSMSATAGAQIGGQLVLLASGGALYSGGTNGDLNPVATAQIYNPSIPGWFQTGSMTASRYGHIAVRLNDSNGRILIAGGEGSDSVILSSAEIFDPSTGIFTATTSMNVARYQANALLIANPVPLIVQPLVPDTIQAGGSELTLVVNGSGFVASSVVNWNGSPLATSFINFDQLTATVPAADVAAAGTASVTVTSPAPGGGTSNVAFFTITNPTNSVSLASSLVGVGFSPLYVTVSDFDNNGTQDLAIVNNCGTDPTCQSAGTVSILLGNGDGTFSTRSNPAVGFQPVSAAVGDFNGDGKLDMAVANNCSDCDNGTVSILLGNGDGTFTAGTSFDADENPVQVIAADFNGDGNLDLAIANYGSNIIRVALGKGDGTFNLVPDLVVGSNPTSLVSGDFNGDGILDLAVTNSGDGTVEILLGNGNGTFAPASVQPVTHMVSPQFITAGDFNHDGKLDLAIADGGSLSLTVLLGNGDGTFSLANSQPSSSQNSTFVSTADFNGDGSLDLAVTGFCGNNPSCVPMITIYLGNGDGTFQAGVNYTAGNLPLGNGVADFNGDGRLDLAVANAQDNTVSVFLQSPMVSLSINPPNLSFGNQPLNTASAPMSFLLTNTGTANLNLSTITITGTNPGDFAETDNCGTVLAFGANCTVAVTFTPMALGARSATLVIPDNAPGSPQTVALSGTGTAQGITCTMAVQNTNPLAISIGSTCTDPSGTIVSATVNWGDGSPVMSLNQQGIATHTYAGAGVYSITVTATDNLMQVGTVSQSLTFTVAAPPVFAGQQSTIPASVVASKGTPTVTFSCSSAIGPNGQVTNDPQATFGITCTFSPPSIQLTGVPQTVSVTITTTGGGTARLSRPSRFSAIVASFGFSMPLAGIVLVGWGLSRKRAKRSGFYRWLMANLLAMALLMLTVSCGGGFTAPPQPPVPPGQVVTAAGAYQLTAVGQDPTGFVQTSLIVPLNVTSSQ